MRELPRGWCWTTLGDLGATCANAITDGPFGSNLKTSHYTDAGPRVVRLQNLGDGFFVDAKAHISEEHFQKLRKHEVEAGDLLLAALGEVLPRACIAPEWLGPAIVKADCIRVRVNNDLSKAECLQFFLNSRPVRKAVASTVHGVGRPRLNLGEFRGIKLPLPPIAEQQRIVAKLDELFSELDAGVAALHRAQRRLARYRQAMIQAAVTGELTQEWRERQLDKIMPGTIGGLPRGWTWTSLGAQLTNIEAGKNFTAIGAPPGEGEVGIVKISAVTWGTYDENESKTVPQQDMVNPRRFIRPGDFLISRANTLELVGACVIVHKATKDIMLSDKVLRLHFTSEAIKPWVLAFLRSRSGRNELEARASGNQLSMRNISQEKLVTIPLPLPPPQEREAILAELDRRLSAVDSLEATLKASLRHSERLRQSILERAFRGELVPQDSNDEPAEVLLKRIQSQEAPKKANTGRGRPAAKHPRREVGHAP